jgi:hypothetical protein
MWIRRNEETITTPAVLMAIMDIIQQQQHKAGNFDEGFMCDGIPWDKTISQINIYHKEEYMIRYQDKLWKSYQKLLDLLASNPQMQKDQEVVYRKLCYGAFQHKITITDIEQ